MIFVSVLVWVLLGLFAFMGEELLSKPFNVMILLCCILVGPITFFIIWYFHRRH